MAQEHLGAALFDAEAIEKTSIGEEQMKQVLAAEKEVHVVNGSTQRDVILFPGDSVMVPVSTFLSVPRAEQQLVLGFMARRICCWCDENGNLRAYKHFMKRYAKDLAK